jgi:hypothetical protein
VVSVTEDRSIAKHLMEDVDKRGSVRCLPPRFKENNENTSVMAAAAQDFKQAPQI